MNPAIEVQSGEKASVLTGRIASTNLAQRVCETCNGRIGCLEVCLLLSVATLIAQLSPDFLRLWRWWHWPGVFGQAELLEGKTILSHVDYLVCRPKGYSTHKRWPMLLYLHGSGQRGDDVSQLLTWGLPRLISEGLQVPMIVVAPLCRANTNWDSRQLLALVDHLQEQLFIDPDRIYVSGESMGGFGTWDLIAVAPARFAAAVPVCGGGDIEKANRMVKLPIWAFHGAGDKVISVDQSQKMVDAVQARGGQARLTIFPDEGHSIGELVFSRNDLYAWLLEHSRRH